MKVSIKPYNQQYLRLIASQMGIDKPSEVINYLLLELKKMGYSFGSPLPQLPPPHPQPQPEQLAHSGLNFQPAFPQAVREYEELAQEIDPVIERLANLIDTF